MRGEFFIDGSGIPRVVFDPRYELLAACLGDLQFATITRCDHWLATLDDIGTGRQEAWEDAGNATSVRVTNKGALIECEFTDPPSELLVPLDDFRAAVEGWRALIATRPQ